MVEPSVVSTHVIIRVLYDEQHGAVDALHLAVHGGQREAVLARAERQRPHVSLRARRQYRTQLLSEISPCYDQQL